ncbi:MAG: SRPBCC family protein [Chitinophagaceae bacterium]|nr:SRPBCC family protein [Chitinophagaceae bacterium]MBL0131672.1 SRPBCC family protein [Chitinophagaceae bacterium]MBL0274158.1 SRPBCC family protein [Chitinophagaceae bacterium]
MPTIHLTTFIAAPVQVVFDLSRHIGLHKESMAAFKEEAVAGTRFGLIENEETVTWRAKHLFKSRLLRVKITEMKKPDMFIGEQLDGDFTQMKHEHHFKPCENGTILIDLFHFESPYGLIGQWVNNLYLTNYIRRLLEQRNKTIKQFAESDKWKMLLIK